MDEELRALERAAAQGKPGAAEKLEGARARAGIEVAKGHDGAYLYHDDDCRCTDGGITYCNRDGHVWSCCGACKEASECTAPRRHPTHWQHPKHAETIADHRPSGRPIYKTNVEIRQIAPEDF